MFDQAFAEDAKQASKLDKEEFSSVLCSVTPQ